MVGSKRGELRQSIYWDELVIYIGNPLENARFRLNPDRPLLRASFFDASCLHVVVPGVLRVSVEMIVIDYRLY